MVTPLTGATQVTLVFGGRASGREARIAAALAAGSGAPEAPSTASTAVILEGLADAGSPLAAWHDAAAITIARIAPGCLCCTGNLVLRVTLNRLLRQTPARLFISLADASHLDTLKAWLLGAPYQQLLTLGPDLVLDPQD